MFYQWVTSTPPLPRDYATEGAGETICRRGGGETGQEMTQDRVSLGRICQSVHDDVKCHRSRRRLANEPAYSSLFTGILSTYDMYDVCTVIPERDTRTWENQHVF